MMKNYLLLALRNIKSNPLYAFLNIAGLGVGLASSILILLWITDEWSYNRFHTNLDSIHFILQNQKQGGQTYTFEATPGPLAAGLRTEMPEVARAARGSWMSSQLLSVGEKNIYERGGYVEIDFLNIFKFPALKGDPIAALRDVNSIVITERTAKKFFGEENPIGKIIRHNNQRDMKVAAVLKDIPRNSSLRFDVLLPFAIFEKEKIEWINSTWGNNSIPTWIELQSNANLTALNQKLENYLHIKNKESNIQLFAYPFSQWRLWREFKEGKVSGGRIDTLRMLGILGIFMLLIACVNFMNLATARSQKRAREVGVRKVLGAFRGMLIGQFLSEALIMAMLALGFGVLLTKLVLPSFNEFFGRALSFTTDNWGIGLAVLGIGLLTGIIAGSYPAFYLSKFNPAKVIKSGAITTDKKGGGIRIALVTFQFCISIFLMISTIVFLKQLEYAQNRPIGYEQDNLVRISAMGNMPKTYEAVKNDLAQIKGIKSVSTSHDDLLQFGENTSGIKWQGKTEDQDFLVTVSWVGLDWAKTAGLKMAQGRDFSADFGSDTLSCILNQTAVKRMGLKEPVVGTVLQRDTTYTVVGVVEDFIFNNALSKVEPLMLCHGREGMSNFFVKVENDNHWKENIAQIEHVVKKHNPSYPVQLEFTKEEYQFNFAEIRFGGQLAKLFGGLAIFISCLGLFGLSAFLAERRQKEIGIRKILGASMSEIWLQLSKDFFKPVIIAFIIATPLALWAMQKVLLKMEYHIQLAWWMFAVAGLLALLIAVVTVSFQGIKAAVANPVKSLRTE
jgi:putative ABC transport system permease protein